MKNKLIIKIIYLFYNPPRSTIHFIDEEKIKRKKEKWEFYKRIANNFSIGMFITGILLIFGIIYIKYFSGLYGGVIGDIKGYLITSLLLGFTYTVMGVSLIIAFNARKYLKIPISITIGFNKSGAWEGYIKTIFKWSIIGLLLQMPFTWFVLTPFVFQDIWIGIFLCYMFVMFLVGRLFELSGEVSIIPFTFGGVGFILGYPLFYWINPYDYIVQFLINII